MNNVYTLQMNKETVYIHIIDNNLYYYEDTTGIYKMNGNAKDYLDYLTNKGWELKDERF